MAASSTFLALALTTLTAAQSSSGIRTTLTLPFYGYDSQSIVGSVISAKSGGLTTISLACPSPTSDSDDDADCGLFPLQTLTLGPSTYHMDMSAGDFTGTQDCQTAMGSGVCTESNGGASANFPGVSTTTYAGSEVARLAVTVTAGGEKLGNAAAATGSSSGTMSGSASTGAAVPMLSGTAKATSTATAASGSASGTSASTGSATGSKTSSATAAASSGAAVRGEMVGVVAVAAGVLGCLAL